MIKLIATDLDGTLLHSDKTLPRGFLQTAARLTESGVIFVAASGRQYDNIYDTLKPVSDGMYIISENGAINGFGKVISEELRMTKDAVRAVLDFVRRSPVPAKAVCCCAHIGLFSDDEPRFVAETGKYYLFKRRVADEELYSSPACKIALYCYGRSDELFPLIPEIPGSVAVISGKDWVDVAPVGVNKGSALSRILKKTAVSPSECLAFGDNFNDGEMLRLCGTAFVTENAPEKMKEMFPVAPSCDDDGVLVKIRELFAMTDSR